MVYWKASAEIKIMVEFLHSEVIGNKSLLKYLTDKFLSNLFMQSLDGIKSKLKVYYYFIKMSYNTFTGMISFQCIDDSVEEMFASVTVSSS